MAGNALKTTRDSLVSVHEDIVLHTVTVSLFTDVVLHTVTVSLLGTTWAATTATSAVRD